MSGFPAYTLPEVSGSEVHQLGQFEDILEGVKKQGFVNSVPENKTEAFDVQNQKIRLQTIASRLYLLGYLRRRIKPRRIHKKIDDIQEAVLKFQRDAGLTQDSWVGDETWYALDELVSFESELSTTKWFENGQVKPSVKNAVHRAIQLRLWCLGLYSRKPRPKSDPLSRKALQKFNRILYMFLIRKKRFVADFNYETLQLLFDQEALTYAIAKRSKPTSGSFFLRLSTDKTQREIDRALSKTFMVNCVKIELWLLGYEVSIDGRDNFKYKEGGELWEAISLYYRQFEGKSITVADKLALKITPQLFLGIGKALRDDENDTAFNADDASEEIAKEMIVPENVQKTTSNIRQAWEFVKEKGMRLWDGLKRVWRWIKKIGRKVVSFIKNNLFKGFYRFVSKAFKIVGKGIVEVVKSIGVYLRGGMVSNGMFFKFSKDMDASIYVSKSISPEDAAAGALKLQKQSKAFSIGCKMIGFAFYIFKNLSLGLLGWAKILYSLLKSYKDLRVLYQDLKFITQ